METSEASSHSFIVKIWRERIGSHTGKVIWRGHVTHVPSGKQRYLRSFDDIIFFISTYAEQLGIEIDLRWRLRRWLATRR